MRVAIRLILADALLDRLVERRLVDDVGLLRQRRGCAQHHRERGAKNSTKHLHELPPAETWPIANESLYADSCKASSVPPIGRRDYDEPMDVTLEHMRALVRGTAA